MSFVKSAPYNLVRPPGLLGLARLIVTGRGIDEMRNVITAALLLVGVSLVAQGRSASTLPPHPPPGQLIDLGGWRLHLNCLGKASASQPTAILEAGSRRFFSGLEPCPARRRSLRPRVLVRPRRIRVERSRSTAPDHASARVRAAHAARQGRRKAALRASAILMAAGWCGSMLPLTRRRSSAWCWWRPGRTIRGAYCRMES